jgi:hypothetical protein
MRSGDYALNAAPGGQLGCERRARGAGGRESPRQNSLPHRKRRQEHRALLILQVCAAQCAKQRTEPQKVQYFGLRTYPAQQPESGRGGLGGSCRK